MSDKYMNLTVDFKQFIEEPDILKPEKEKIENPYYIYPRTIREFDVRNLNTGCKSREKEENKKIDEIDESDGEEYFEYVEYVDDN